MLMEARIAYHYGLVKEDREFMELTPDMIAAMKPLYFSQGFAAHDMDSKQEESLKRQSSL